ncbi:MAG: oxygen-independent coproporphyrinogen III oxidase [Epulopiscium sp.]|nr:oxygen-independent coproporphyrinogen III oxidase [Candidatus Epulonipiscium sp.]
MDNRIGLYIHIPFCKSKCYYCDFASYANQNEKMKAYVLALTKEIKHYGKIFSDKKVDSIFIGGGTPTVLPLDLIKELMQTIFCNFSLEYNAEITIESNPGTLNKEMLKLLKRLNINRLSIGLQACQNNLLKAIGRIHTVEDFNQNFFHAREAGFNNINVDLMFALPNQTIKDWQVTLEYISDLSPEHISCYSLIIEEGTPFGKWEEQGKIKRCDEKLDRCMYHYAKKYLNSKEYKHYEISNFSKPSSESKHNLIYWQYKPYIGMGLGAHSFVDGKRYHNTYNLEKYIQAKGEIRSLQEDIEILPPSMQYSEYIFLGLRLLKGISIKEFEVYFKTSFDKLFGESVKKLIELRLLEKNKDRINLTSKGLDVSNTVFTEFLL